MAELDLSGYTDAQINAYLDGIDDLLIPGLAEKAAKNFNYEGFEAFFRVLHGSPLHREGEKWVQNIFVAMKGRRKLLQEAFRGSGKTTVISKFFLAFYMGHHPHTTNGVIRVNGQKANETTSEIAALIDTDERWKQVFPHVVPDKDRGWGQQSGYFLKRTDMSHAEWQDVQRKSSRPNGPTFIGYGYDSGSVQGFRTNGLILIDDIHVKENTRSDRQLADVKGFVKEQLLPIPVPNEGIEIWCYTPFLTNDAYAERKETGLYIHNYSPVMVEGDGEPWPESFDDETLDAVSYPFAGKSWVLAWPERWGFRELAEKYLDIGHITFAREYLLDLQATQGQKLKMEYLGFYDNNEIDPRWDTFFGVDYASVADKLKHKDRDYFCIAVGKAIPSGGIVLVDGVRKHVTKAEGLELLSAYAQRYGQTLKKIVVEDIGKGEEFYNDSRLLDDIAGKPLPIYPVPKKTASKGWKFEEWLAPRFNSRRMWITDKPNTFVEQFITEWLTYPTGEHDDTLDATYLMGIAGETRLFDKTERTYKTKKENPFAKRLNYG